MTLLYEAAKKAHKDDLQINSSALNPTTGVKRRHPDMLKKIVWRPDPNQPSHGVFVATDLDPNSELLTDLAPNTLITGTQDPSPRDATTASQPPPQSQQGPMPGPMSAQPIGQWSNPGTANGENVTYLHLDPALTYLPDMPEVPVSSGDAYDTAMLLNMFDQTVSLLALFRLSMTTLESMLSSGQSINRYTSCFGGPKHVGRTSDWIRLERVGYLFQPFRRALDPDG